MAEGEKKPEEGKGEEKKMEETKPKEKAKAEEPKVPPPPQEIVLKVYMHCEGCARKVRRCLKGFEGVEDVMTDCKTHKVVVKGEKADPMKVLERIQKKSNRQVELISPIPKPALPEPKKEEAPKPEEKKEEPQVVVVVLSVQMHCEACAEEIKRRILKMKGVNNVEPDLKSSQVTVKGVFDSQKLVGFIHKRTGKHVSIVKQEPEKKKEETNEKKEEAQQPAVAAPPATEAPQPAVVAPPATEAPQPAVVAPPASEAPQPVVAAPPVVQPGPEAGNAVEAKKSELYITDPVNFQIYPQPQRFDNAYAFYPPAPQMFSDENPNACTVM